MEDHDNKTIMCSVLFLDIVEYSRKPVSGQIILRDGINKFLAAALLSVPVNDRIVLDAGDGAAISFMGDAGDALKAALILREKLLTEGVRMEPPLLVRMGINFGPVRLVREDSGQLNIVGDGINVAQRIMGFANPNQILVSRSYHEAITRQSQEYAEMFDYQGSRTDRHVRDHEIFAVSHQGEAAAARQKPGNAGMPETAAGRGAARNEDGQDQVARSGLLNASSQQRVLYIAIIAGALLLLAVVGIKIKSRSAAPLPQAAEAQVKPAVVQAGPAPVKAEPAVVQTTSGAVAAPPKIAEPAAENKPKTIQPVQEKPKQASAEQEKAGKKIPGDRKLKETAVVKPDTTALVSVAVTPWGEIYLDGRMQGVSPPLTELHVTAGKHAIEIRNTTFPAYTQNIQVNAGEQIKIKHKFAN